MVKNILFDKQGKDKYLQLKAEHSLYRDKTSKVSTFQGQQSTKLESHFQLVQLKDKIERR